MAAFNKKLGTFELTGLPPAPRGVPQVAERAGISRPTLHSIELGLPTVSIGLYFQVLLVLGLENDILQVAQDDILGRKLQDANLITKGRSPKRTTPHE